MANIKGVLLEYGGELLGPIPNIVIFQFNPDEMTRNIEIPERPSGTRSSEVDQAGEKPVETISFSAEFDASTPLNNGNPVAFAFGVGHQLAALEKMVRPPAGNFFANIAAAVDKIGDLIGGSDEEEIVNPIPRQAYPKILFIWGLTRVLPVSITRMSITETQYDGLLNPVSAKVELTLSLKEIGPCNDDKIAQGAYIYSDLIKDTQAVANLANNAGSLIADIIEIF